MYISTFLMRDGRVANWDLHLERFRAEATFTPAAEVNVFNQLREAGPGVLLPTIEIVGSTISVDPRPSVVPEEDIIVDAEGIVDLRRRPTEKGPDFGWQVRQLQRVRSGGADAGLLIDDRGFVISGIFSSLLCFDEGTAYMSAHPHAPVSVTLEATLAILAETGVEVIELPDGFPITMLRRHETWLLSSRAGVRKVTGWLEYGSAVAPRATAAPRGGVPTHREINERMWREAGSV